jgi:hypothetical protein
VQTMGPRLRDQVLGSHREAPQLSSRSAWSWARNSATNCEEQPRIMSCVVHLSEVTDAFPSWTLE